MRDRGHATCTTHLSQITLKIHPFILSFLVLLQTIQMTPFSTQDNSRNLTLNYSDIIELEYSYRIVNSTEDSKPKSFDSAVITDDYRIDNNTDRHNSKFSHGIIFQENDQNTTHTEVLISPFDSTVKDYDLIANNTEELSFNSTIEDKYQILNYSEEPSLASNSLANKNEIIDEKEIQEDNVGILKYTKEPTLISNTPNIKSEDKNIEKEIHKHNYRIKNNTEDLTLSFDSPKVKDKDRSVIEKLKIDDATRTKLYFDFQSTIDKKKPEATVDTLILDFVNETNFDNVTLFANESLFFDTLMPEYQVPFSPTNDYETATPGSLEELRPSISILGLFELSIGDTPRPDGLSELAAARLAVQHVNQRQLLPGYTLQLITNDTKCDPGVGVDRFFHALYTEERSRMVMLLGTACSDVTESIAKIVPYWNIVQVSFGSTSPALSDRNEFPLFCRTVAPDSSHNLARIAFIRQFGWDTVTAFSQNEEVYSLAVNELVTQLEAANITCAASITFAETDFKEQLQQLKDLDIRIIIGSFSQEMIPKIFCEAHRLGMFGPQYAWLVAGAPPIIRAAPCTRAQLAQALEGLVLVDSHRAIVGEDTSFAGLTNEMFYSEMSGSGVPLSPYAPQTYDAVWAIALALSKAESYWQSLEKPRLTLEHFDYNRKDMAEEFLNQLGNLSFLGVSGPVSFSGADRIGTSAFYQIQGGRPKSVALYTNGRELTCANCAKAQWAGGIPAARRILVLKVDSVWPPARLAVSTLAGLGVALALTFLAFNLHYSKRRSIKLSSPRLNNMTSIGCVLVYTSVALLGVDYATLPAFVPFSALCTVRVYILSAGFSLAFGSMFAKTYRVHRIFVSNRSGVCKTKLLQDTQLISLVCFLLIIDAMIVTLWGSLDPMTRQLKNLTVEYSPEDRSVVYQPQVEVCQSQNTTGWLLALYAYKGLFLLVGVYMAWETRNVNISALNDSKYIGISVYSVVITSISVVVIGTLISDRTTLAYITISSLILITTTSTLCLLFLPKIVAIRTKGEEDPIIQSMGLRLECKTRRFVTDDTRELHFRIEIQNKVYKREVDALDKEIGRLERLLSEPHESSSSSTASIALHRRTELNTVDEEHRHSGHRTQSITGGLPMLLLSVLPPVIPRASWPSAEAFRGRNSVSFSSQPKLNRKSQPNIDLYNLCLNKRNEETGFLGRLKSLFGSRPTSRKASTMSIADPTNQSIASALKMHVGMLTGLVPGNRKNSMVVSCNTLNVPPIESRLRRESFARSGPIIRVIDDSPPCRQKYIAEPETRVNFVLPIDHRETTSNEKIKGSPRFPHRISPSVSGLDLKRKSADCIFAITGKVDEQRRFSHQNCDDKDGRKWYMDSEAGPSGL